MFMPLQISNSLIPYYLKRLLLWRYDVTGNYKTYVGLHVMAYFETRQQHLYKKKDGLAPTELRVD